MNPSLTLISYLWWGPFRKPFEGLMRRVLPNRTRVLFGPLRDCVFLGGLSQRLGIYEVHVQLAICRSLDVGGVFYDIGANNGFLALLGARRVGPEGCIYAFEPFPPNLERIQRALQDNKVLNCIVVPQAVSNVSGMGHLSLALEGDWSKPSLISGGNDRTVSVQTTTLDEFVARNRWPTLIKLDVEGAEVLVLQGASRLLTSGNAPKWIIEIHSQENDRSIQELMASYGYRCQPLPHLRKDEVGYPRHIVAFQS